MGFSLSDVAGELSSLTSSQLATDDLTMDLKEMVSTGITTLDCHIGGGLPYGRTVVIYAPQSVGKSTLAHKMAASWQAKGEYHFVHVLETESALDKMRCAAIGMDLEKTIISQAATVEEGFLSLEKVIKFLAEKTGGKARVLSIWDSISTATTDAESSDDKFSAGMGNKSREIHAGFRRITGTLSKNKSTLLVIAQVHTKIGGYTRPGMPPPMEISGGGLAIKFAASTIIKLKKGDAVMSPTDATLQIGHMVDVTMEKNKVAIDKISFPLFLHGQLGYQEIRSLCEYLTINKSKYLEIGGGGWYKFKTPDVLDEYIPEDKRLIPARAAIGFENLAKSDPFVYRSLVYYAFLTYCERYPLMALRYRHLMWQKQVDMIRAWNASYEEHGGQPVPISQFPKQPPEVSKEELRALNSELALLHAEAEAQVLEEEHAEQEAIKVERKKRKEKA